MSSITKKITKKQTIFNVLFSVFLLLNILIVLSSSYLVYAYMDSDGDGVPDEFDRCPGSGSEILPSPKNNPEYLGCSCTQIFESMNDSCKEVYCVPGRPLQIRDAVYSVESILCPKSFCVGSTLYEYPTSIRPLCVGGVPRESTCSYKIVERSESCIFGLVPQFDDLPDDEKPEEIFYGQTEITQPDKIYLLLRNEPKLKYNVLISTDAFEQLKLEVQRNSVTEKIVEKQLRTIGGADVVITTHSISIIPNKYKSLKKVYVFEEVYDKNILNKQIVHLTKEPFLFKDQNVMVWIFDDISKPFTISYQFNEDNYYESNIVVVAEVKNHFFTNVILPFILTFLMGAFLVYRIVKSLKKEKIFK